MADSEVLPAPLTERVSEHRAAFLSLLDKVGKRYDISDRELVLLRIYFHSFAGDEYRAGVAQSETRIGALVELLRELSEQLSAVSSRCPSCRLCYGHTSDCRLARVIGGK